MNGLLFSIFALIIFDKNLQLPNKCNETLQDCDFYHGHYLYISWSFMFYFMNVLCGSLIINISNISFGTEMFHHHTGIKNIILFSYVICHSTNSLEHYYLSQYLSCPVNTYLLFFVSIIK